MTQETCNIGDNNHPQTLLVPLKMSLELDWRFQNEKQGYIRDTRSQLSEQCSRVPEKCAKFASSARSIVDMPVCDQLYKVALTQVWISEKKGGADKYGWFNARKIPWCAAFINWTLAQAWLPWTGSNMAMSFIWLSGRWHAGIITPEGKMVSGNYGNKVSETPPMKSMVAGYAIPTAEWLQKFPGRIPVSQVPPGAIAVFSRNSKDTRAT
jgi:hypothetical protein